MSLWYYAIIGLVGGIVSTLVMTLIEIISWKKWGLHGVFEWHENQILSKRLLRLSDESDTKNIIHFKSIFFLHFLNGTLAGIAFPIIIYSFGFLELSNIMSIYLLGIAYGFVLWSVTLLPIHKPITGLSPWNHPLGRLPALASLGGHIMYGMVLGIVVNFWL
ncbi:MAG: hypothetical protein WAM88_03800 [Nitrososphaeraceae archaeon]